jgi:hypothetical protein
MSVVNPGTKVMYFPDFDGPTMEFLVLEHDSIGKAYLVQRPGSAPKWEDEKSLRRFLLSYPRHMRVPANELDPDDPLLLEYSRYETSGGRARTAAVRAVKAIQINVNQLEQASDIEEDEQDDAPPTQRARHARTATISIGITVHTGGVGADLQPFLQCPITHEIMNDPVIAADGQTYERRALARWLRRNNSSPLTGLEMDAWMVPNHAVKSMIAKLNSTSA